MNFHVGNGLGVQDEEEVSLKEAYLAAIHLLERSHRRFLDVVKDELERLGHDDINNIQAILLFNIGEEELAPCELKARGYYLGSNVSYNLKKLMELGFIEQRRSTDDRRTVKVRLTAKGRGIVEGIEALIERHLASLAPIGGVTADDLAGVNRLLKRLERYWTDQVLYRL